MTVRPALVLTGPPAVGKSSAARSLAASRPRCAAIGVDDLRQLVRAGAAAPWEGEKGARQVLLGARNACLLASSFIAEDIDVVIADVLTPRSAPLHRELLPGCLVLRLSASLSETRGRSESRYEWLTSAQFEAVHRQEAADPPDADLAIDVGHLEPKEQYEAIDRVWRAKRGG